MRSHRLVIAAAGALSLVSAAPHAQTPLFGAVAAKSGSAEADRRDWARRFDEWTAPHIAILNEGTNLLLQIAFVMRNNPGKYAPAAITTWTKDKRNALYDLNQRLAAIPSAPAPAPPPSLAADINAKRFFTVASSFRAYANEAFQRDSVLARAALDQIQAASAGDATAARTLEPRAYELEAAAREGERVVLAVAINATPESSPQEEVLRSVDETLLAQIDVYRFAANALSGAPVDRAALAASLHGHARLVRNAGEALGRWADQRLPAIRTDAPGKTESAAQTRARRIAQTYGDSALAERDIAAALDQLADRLGDPAATAAQAVAQLEAMAPLLKRRDEVEEKRNALRAS